MFFTIAHGSESLTPWFLSLTVNGRRLNTVDLFLETNQGELLISENRLKQLNIKPPISTPLYYDKEPYYSINTFPGATYKIDKRDLHVELTIPATAFSGGEFNEMSKQAISLTLPDPGGFLNYDLNAQRSNNSSQVGGVFEAGIFNPLGVGISGFLLSHNSRDNMIRNQRTNSSLGNKFVRLNTSFIKDYPETMKTLRIGDGYTASSEWGRLVGFGGIQWASNFNTNPAFVKFPLPSLTGEAIVPSSVDLYVNDALISRRQVDAGPFTISDIPTITSQGTVRAVTTDLLGRQQVIEVPYYAGYSLLKPGLHEFSYEAGFIRRNFGRISNDYGRFIASGFSRVGITDKLTLGWRGQALLKEQALGVEGSYLVDHVGTFNFSVAASNSEKKLGQFASLGYRKRMKQGINIGVNLKMASRNFTQLGVQNKQLPLNTETQVFVGVPTSYGASMGLSYTQQNYRDKKNVNLVSANYAQRLGKNTSLSLTGLSNVGGESNKSVFLSLTFLLDGQRTAGLTANARPNNQYAQGRLTRSLSETKDWGYNVQAGTDSRYQGTLNYRNEFGDYSATASVQNRQTGYRVTAQGGIAFMDSDFYFTKRITDSFGVVTIPGYSGIGVYADNRWVANTNKKGKALIPGLRSYGTNRISFDPNQLPMDAQIEADNVRISPYYRTGVLLAFPVKKIRAATMKLMMQSGEPVPAGAFIYKSGSETEQFPVGEGGFTYLAELEDGNNLFIAKWNDTQCSFAFDYIETDDLLPDLGDILCETN